jgi:uncharacterized protein YyaL (SSP411 family)
MQRNRLAAQTSPYLLQHAENPVDWYPWGEEALGAALLADKPILLSVGYSACHWCHVMAHESFEDPGIAALMNRLFVNIKVDREERPDLDAIYQIAQQLITQRGGGWPLTMFLAPEDRRPFFGGTYFPKEARHGLPGFADVLRRVAQYFESHRAEIRTQNAQLALAFERLSPLAAPEDTLLDDLPLVEARRVLERTFDASHGGFGAAPKFPQPSSVERCLRHWHDASRAPKTDLKALYMATLTLTRMAEGGIFDQLGGGFSRYSVDEFWMIPHFEKMLYDNGQLLSLYAWACLATGEGLFARVAGDTAEWVLRDMRAPSGGFYSSLDADSEGREGEFYLWSRAEVAALLTPAEHALFAARYGLDGEPNFEGEWHLHAVAPLEKLPPLEGESAAAVLDRARAKLLAARNLRIWPARDEKVLTSWNALTIKGLALAGRVLHRSDLTLAAAGGVDFIHHTLWKDGRLLATFKDGRAHLPAYLDDHAFLADALLELLQNRWRSSDLDFARRLIDVLLDKFEDKEAGGFFFTASDHEELIHRRKSFGDDSMPSGNGIAASVLCRMGCLLGDLHYLKAAERTLKAARPSMLDHPGGHMGLMNALDDFLTPPEIVVIRGESGEALTWARELGALYAPSRLIFAIPNDAQGLPPALADKRPGRTTTAYVCNGMTCSAPLTDLAALASRLASRGDG